MRGTLTYNRMTRISLPSSPDSSPKFPHSPMPRRRNKVDEITGFRASYHSEAETVDDLEPTLDRFADDTSMLGFRYLHSRYKTWFRLMWALFLIFFMGLTFYQVSERITYYFIFNPLATRRSFDAPSEVQFPALLICNKMQLKASRVSKQSQSLLKAMCYLHDEEGSFNVTHSLEEFDHVDLPEVYRNSLQTADDLVLSCEYEKGKSCIEDVRPMLTPQGLCFTVAPNMTVRRPGPETTLTILLNLETYEIIPGTVSEPGVLISLYDRSTPPSAHFTSGIHLDAGKVVSIPINDIRSSRLTVSRVFHWKGRLIPPFSSPVTQIIVYEAVESECGCVPTLSPRNREILARNSPLKEVSSGDPLLLLAPCTFKQEVTCVENITSHLQLSPPGLEDCPDDCNDISYSSVVFGGQLSASEVATIVRTDWEDDKEKRLSQFMPAFEIIPNTRIPLVRAVQDLALEAQSFLTQALDSLGVTSASVKTVPCISDGGVRTLERTLTNLHTSERMWKHLSNFVEFVMIPHLSSVFDILHLNVTADFDVEIVSERDDYEVESSKIDQALFDLSIIQGSLETPMNSYGLRNIEQEERQKVVNRTLTEVQLTRRCIFSAKDATTPKEKDAILRNCSDIFAPVIALLQATRFIANSHDSTIATTYELMAGKLVTMLQKMKFVNTPKVFEWTGFDIRIKQFEQLYKDGGRDNQEIVELLKMRKVIHVDLLETISSLSIHLRRLLSSRESFLEGLDIPLSAHANLSIAQIESICECLDELPPKLLNLKKSSFLRAEWMSRVQRQVAIAQSYSPGTQYDEVNLLLVKVYFAHFKQETIIQEKSYNVFLLLAEIGGTIGLYVGATLLTIAETIVFFFETRTRNWLIKPDHV